MYSNTLFDFFAPHFPVVVEPPLTWARMTKIEPRLAIIEAEARRLRRSSNRWRIYESLKRHLQALVGWNAADAQLATADAYEIAVGAILRALEGRR